MNDKAYIPKKWKTADRHNVVDADVILKVVQDHFGIDRDQLMAPSKKIKIVYPRQVCAWLLDRYSIHGAHGIAVLIGYANHQSATAAIRAIDCYLLTDELTKAQLIELQEKIKNGNTQQKQ